MISQEQKDFPLVSIVVLTYNSSKYVLETLESAYNQTYEGPMELIVSDDCSTDDTVEICKDWIAKCGKRFHRAELIDSMQNHGVSRNINVGCRAARGCWIKPIAGDDVLLPECIKKMVTFHLEHPSIKVSNFPVIAYYGKSVSGIPKIGKIWKPVEANSVVNVQYALNHEDFFLPAPGYFYSSFVMEQVGYFPVECRNIEDMPMLWRLLSNGIDVSVQDIPLVLYRVQDQSLTSCIGPDNRCALAKIRHANLLPRLNCYAAGELILQTCITYNQNKRRRSFFDRGMCKVLSFVKKIYRNCFSCKYEYR